jgi:hypothetical protein
MLFCERVGDTAEFQRWGVIEGGGAHGDETIPAGLDGDGSEVVEG